MVQGTAPSNKTYYLNVTMVGIGNQNILLGLYPVLHKIITDNGPKKHQIGKMMISIDPKKNTCYLYQGKNGYRCMDTGIQIKIEQAFWPMHKSISW